jgi:hypothetical protein
MLETHRVKQGFRFYAILSSIGRSFNRTLCIDRNGDHMCPRNLNPVGKNDATNIESSIGRLLSDCLMAQSRFPMHD